MSHLEAALSFVQNGYRIFPCAPLAKRPAGALAPHGFKDASSDPEQITRWWDALPLANIGLPTDAANGVFVLDVDPPHGQESWTRLCAGHEPPQTYTVQTPSGGMHLYFRWPAGGQRRRIKVWPGLDFMGEGGYVVAPPSVLEAGAYQIMDHSDLAEVPEWLLAALAPLELAAQSPVPPSSTTLRVPVPQSIPVGQRDDSLYRIACSYRGEGLGQNAILDRLRVDNRRCTEPLDEMSLARIARSASRHPAGVTPPSASAGIITTDDKPIKNEIEPFIPLDLWKLHEEGIPTLDWLIPGWLVNKDVAIIGGEAGVGKSTTAAFLARSLAEGTDWLGLTPCRRVPVLYFDEEQGDEMVARLFLRLGPPIPGLSVFSGQGVNLSDPASVARLEAAIRSVGPPAVVFLDTIQQTFGVNDANSATQVGLIYSVLFRLRDTTGCTFVLLHHISKPRQDESAGGKLSLHRLRDSTVHGTQSATVWFIQSANDSAVEMFHVKRRGAEKRSMRVNYRTHEDRIILEGEESFVAESVGDQLAAELSDYIHSKKESGRTELNEIAKRLGASSRTLDKTLSKLIREHSIYKLSRGLYAPQIVSASQSPDVPFL